MSYFSVVLPDELNEHLLVLQALFLQQLNCLLQVNRSFTKRLILVYQTAAVDLQLYPRKLGGHF